MLDQKNFDEQLTARLEEISKIVGFSVELSCAENGVWKPYISDRYLVPPKSDGHNPTYYRISCGSKYVTQFVLLQFPNCCAFCISTSVLVWPEYRGLGVNKIGIQIRQLIAKYTGYCALICTDIESNTAERRTLRGAGFTDIFSRKNYRTGNLVNISVKEL